MTAVGLAKPATVTSAVITGGELGDGALGTELFVIKVESIDETHRTQKANVTGDGDTSTNFVTNCFLESRFVLRGYMASTGGAASGDLGIANMTVAANNPVEAVVLNYASGRTRTLTKAIVEVINTRYKRDAPAIAVALVLYATETAPSAFEA